MKLNTFITNLMILFAIILNCVLNSKTFKKPTIETLINNRNTSNIQINLNNTSNQIVSVIFDDEKENLKSNYVNEDNELDNNLTPINNLDNFDLYNYQENMIIDKAQSMNHINPPAEEDTSLDDNYFNNENSNLKKKQQNFLMPKKLKYSEAFKNIKKIKSRLNSLNNNNKVSNKHIAVKDKNFENSENVENNLSANNLSKITETNIKDEVLFEEFLKKKGNWRKKKYLEEDNNAFMFYNSLSLIMLSMLGGGVVGVIFILYFTFKNDSTNGMNS